MRKGNSRRKSFHNPPQIPLKYMATEIQTLVTRRNVPCISTVRDQKRRLQIWLREEYDPQSSGLLYNDNVRCATCSSVRLKCDARWVCLAYHMQGGQGDSGTPWAGAGGRSYCVSRGEYLFVFVHQSAVTVSVQVNRPLPSVWRSFHQNASSLSALLETHYATNPQVTVFWKWR